MSYYSSAMKERIPKPLSRSSWVHLDATIHSEGPASRNAGFIRQSEMSHGPLPDKSGVPVKRIPKPLSSWSSLTRRQFLSRTALTAGAVTLSFPYVGRVLGANDRINVACIGVGGKGDSDSSAASGC